MIVGAGLILPLDKQKLPQIGTSTEHNITDYLLGSKIICKPRPYDIHPITDGTI
jgi:hypothetical protein